MMRHPRPQDEAPKTSGQGIQAHRKRHPSPSGRDEMAPGQPPAELRMGSHTHRQIPAPRKPGKRDAIDFSLYRPQQSQCRNGNGNILYNPLLPPETSKDSSSCSAETEPNLGEERRLTEPELQLWGGRSRQPSSTKMHGSRRDVSVDRRMKSFLRRKPYRRRKPPFQRHMEVKGRKGRRRQNRTAGR